MDGEDLIASAIGGIVDAGGLAGAATTVWRDGKVVQRLCVGWRDVELAKGIGFAVYGAITQFQALASVSPREQLSASGLMPRTGP